MPSRSQGAAASCKHLAAYSLEGAKETVSRHGFDAKFSAQDLADTYLPAFKACVEAGAKGLMCAYNSINGVPACASDLMRTAREKWGFDGVVVSDCDAVADIANVHAYTNDQPPATHTPHRSDCRRYE